MTANEPTPDTGHESEGTAEKQEEKPSLKSAGVESVAHIGGDVNAEVSGTHEEGYVDIRLSSDGDHGRMIARLFAEPEEARALARQLEEVADRIERTRGFRWRCAACDALLVDEEAASRHNHEEHGGISSMVEL